MDKIDWFRLSLYIARSFWRGIMTLDCWEIVMTVIPLRMFGEGDGRFYITNRDRKRQIIRWPEESAMRERWRRHNPKATFKLCDPPTTPTVGITIQVGGNMTEGSRKAFCRDLLAICQITAYAP
jgi:hypothetical protein